MKGMNKGEWNTNNDYKHNNNQAIYVSKGKKSIL
jgi:hypothetical protein